MSLAIAGVVDHPGLTEEEARRRLAAEGFNELPGRRRRGLGTIALEVVREPMILLLLSASSVYLALGDRREAIVLLASIVVVVAISIYQNQKTERALEALKDLASPRALVIREGCLRRVPGRDVVRDDVVILSEGDRVPADALLLAGMSLLVDESLLGSGQGEPGDPVRRSGGGATALRADDDDRALRHVNQTQRDATDDPFRQRVAALAPDDDEIRTQAVRERRNGLRHFLARRERQKIAPIRQAEAAHLNGGGCEDRVGLGRARWATAARLRASDRE